MINLMKENKTAFKFVKNLNSLGLKNLITNVNTEVVVVQVGQYFVPATINQFEYDNSYVCSPYTAYISYARDELGLLESKFLQKSLSIGFFFMSRILKFAEINHTVSINNWLVSTNLIPDWEEDDVNTIKNVLIKDYPKHSLSIRSINEKHHANLMETLKQQGWYMIPARKVYLFDNEDQSWWRRNHTKKDQSLLRKVEVSKLPLDWVKPEELLESDFTEMATCFRQLFIEKHSQYNPQFTAEFFFQLHQSKTVEFHSFRHKNTGKIVATIGLCTQQNTITTPIVGYDISQPKEMGLYRILMAVLLKLTYQRQQPMNLSSGAGSFKRARGGEPVLEYTAYYTQHLGVRNTLHSVFSNLANRYAPKILSAGDI